MTDKQLHVTCECGFEAEVIETGMGGHLKSYAPVSYREKCRIPKAEHGSSAPMSCEHFREAFHKARHPLGA